MQPYSSGRRGKEAAAVPAKEPFQQPWHSHSGAGADLPGYLHISVASLRMSGMRLLCQQK